MSTDYPVCSYPHASQVPACGRQPCQATMSGQASGGDGNCLNGSAAAAGYTNGRGRAFELPGSGVDNALTSSNPTTGLSHREIGTTTPVFPVRAGFPYPLPASGYVALGDSYSSGEGLEPNATSYIAPSNTDGCHRSTAAYPERVATGLGANLNQFNTFPTNAFVACSGAVTSTLVGGRDGEPSQLLALSAIAKYVTLTIGGNDIGFANILNDCMDLTAQLSAIHYTASSIFASTSQCNTDLERAQYLLTPGNSSISTIQATLQTVYSEVMALAPNARLLVLNYPQIFTTSPVQTFCPVTGGFDIAGVSWYASLSPAHVSDFDIVETELNHAIAGAVDSLSAEGRNIQMIDITGGTQTSALPCNTVTNGSSDINALRFAAGSTVATIVDDCNLSITHLVSCPPGTVATIKKNVLATGSFHPKAIAHQFMASRVESAIG